jgi:pyridoxine 5-phosphate synthase
MKNDFSTVHLGVNIDHVATLRQARKRSEPDPVWAAVEAILGGADSITVHLREDRRHIQDHDVERLALKVRPAMAMLVPEKRTEVTTEGGLDVAGQKTRLRDVIARLKDAGIRASVFIDPEDRQISASAEIGAAVCEIHTGAYANASPLDAPTQVELVRAAGQKIIAHAMQFNAGHGLNYLNVQPIAALPGLVELHIGHSIVSRSVFTGIRAAVAEMKRLITTAAPSAR